MSERLVICAIITLAASGVPGVFLSRQSNLGQWVTTLLTVIGALLGLAGVSLFLGSGESQELSLPWPVPGGRFAVVLDGISAVFLLPILLITLLGSVYGLGYWKQTEHPENGCKLRLFYGLLAAAMALVVIARNGILFLASWEVMALSAFFLVTTEDRDPAVRQAGWIYLVATHMATLCLFALFALLRSVSGSFTLAPLADDTVPAGMQTAIFVLALLGFGLKAGIMPLHIWLPSSHAIAPSHVSALMSGVIIKMGIYGIVRVCSLFPHPPIAWGSLLLGLGVVSGVLGVAFAIGQHDLKRLLAYHSIENIGIIVMGIGLALVGRSLGQVDWVVLGLGAALLHVWNHALFKALLFLSAGSVIHAVHTREIDQLGGLAKIMPRTALCFLIGAVAICGLPPLNGFVSEFLLYLGLFRTLGIPGGPSYTGAAFAAPALALIGTLAVACFVKVFGVVFLGSSRSPHAAHAHESGPTMIGPMIVLVVCCCFIGLAPGLAAPLLDNAVAAWAPGGGTGVPRLAELSPLGWISATGFLLLAAIAAGGLWYGVRLRASPIAAGPTWGCGYAAPSPRMQYTSSSFAEMLVALFAWALRPQTRAPHDLALFPQKTDYHSEVPDAVLDRIIVPVFHSGAGLFAYFRVLQRGSIQTYLLYIFVALLALLLWR
jgi:hydrogenase-4 component B